MSEPRLASSEWPDPGPRGLGCEASRQGRLRGISASGNRTGMSSSIGG